LAANRTRLSLVEYGAPVDVARAIREAVGIEHAKAQALLLDAGNRAAASLGLGYNPIIVDGRGTRAIDFAGLIRIGPSLELEVSPKFLGLDDTDSSWREDFFFLSTLSSHGRLLELEGLASSGGAPRDLSTLVARSVTRMYEVKKRRPLRSYRKLREEHFFIEGDPDPIDLIFPSADGFAQEVIQLDRRNPWNANIVAAATELLPEVSDPSIAGSLVRLIKDLSPQGAPSPRAKPVPSRQRAWEPLHELSLDILKGLGLTYRLGPSHAPGYLVATWRIWEDLLTVALRLGFGRSAVLPQKGFALGDKTRIPSGASSTLSVFPDCIIEPEDKRPRIILDAKYKGRIEKAHLRLAESDIYEALAFAKATGADRAVLAYPAAPISVVRPPGTCIPFEMVQVDAVQIVGVQVESRLISKRGALKTFAENLRSGVSTLFV
jgi:5-methylcytosine-specific restriction enzyme subunit McrC